MTRYAIVTDLNRCVGCLGCSVACKLLNGVPVGSYWNKVLRVGPFPKEEGAEFPNVYTYFLPMQCQHCENPECVKVCPTGASHKREDGTVQVDKEKCIGCQFCVMACPYGVRYLNEEERVVEKCTLCQQRIAQGELPQCVVSCGSHARWFGDLDAGDQSTFEALTPTSDKATGYEDMMKTRTTAGEWLEPFDQSNIHHLTDVGNKPVISYILRDPHTWQGEE